MKNGILRLELRSDALIASGEGFGGIIDSDIHFDAYGLPFIPGRRLKGILHEAAYELNQRFVALGLKELALKEVFGHSGQIEPASMFIPNLLLESAKESGQWLDFLKEDETLNSLLGKDRIMNQFTQIRHQTAIDSDGIVADHSLRTIRVARKGLVFSTDITIPETALFTFALSCRQASAIGIGAKRRRGFGAMDLQLVINGQDQIPNAIGELEACLV